MQEPEQEQQPAPEPVGSWLFERNTWAEDSLGIPNRSKGAVAETCAVVGISTTESVTLPAQPRVSGLRPRSGCGSGSCSGSGISRWA